MSEGTIDDIAGTGDGKVFDANDWQIEETARVHVMARPGLDGHGEVSSFGGVVVGAKPGQVDIIEFKTFNFRSVYPRFVKVQPGASKASEEYAAAVEYLKRRRLGAPKKVRSPAKKFSSPRAGGR